MKLILFALLNFSICFSQNLTKDQKEILNQEILRTRIDYPLAKDVLGDSILIRKELYRGSLKFDMYKSESEENRYLTEKQFDDIFGSGEKQFDIDKNTREYWNNEDFPDMKVAFYFPEKYTKIINGQRSGLYFGKLTFVTLGIPVIKKDGKYGIIQWYTEYYGNSISIYKKINGEWKFYNTFSSMLF